MNRRLSFLGVLVAALIAVRAALPYGLEWLVEREGAKALGLAVTVGDIDLALHRGQLTVEGLAVGGDEAPRLRSDRILADFHVLDLFRRRVRLERLEFGRAEIALALLADGSLAPLVRSEPPGEPAEVSPVIVEKESTEPPEPAEDPAAWPFWIDQLALTDFQVLLVSPAAGDTPPLDLSLEELRFSDFTLIDGALSFGTVGLDGSRARLRRDLQFVTEEADVAPPPSESHGPESPSTRLELADLSIDDAQLTLESGDIEVDLRLSLSARDIALDPDARFPLEVRIERGEGSLNFAGEAGANPPALEGTLSAELLSVAHLLFVADPNLPLRISEGTLAGEVATRIALDAAGASATLDGHVEVAGVSGDAEGRDFELSLARLDVGALAFVPDAGETAVTADSLVLHGEGVAMHDTTVDPTFLMNLLTVDASASGVRWPAVDAKFELSAKGIQRFRTTATGQLTNGVGMTDVKLENISLADVSGYTAGSGIQFERGMAGVEGSIDSAEATHDVNLVLELEDMEASTVDPGVFQRVFGMTPDVALAVLRDPSGSVEVPILFEVDRVSGKTDFSRRRLLASALTQAVTGVGTTPLKSMAFAKNAVFHDDGTLQFDPIPFEPGAEEWAPSQEDYLDALARMLSSRPALGIRLAGRADEDEAETLAGARASLVAEALRQRQVSPDRITLAKPKDGDPVVEIAIVPAAPAVSAGKDQPTQVPD